MALTPQECLSRLRVLYSHAHHCNPPSDHLTLAWARTADSWATYAVRHYGWSYIAAEAVVRHCRILIKRATLAVAGAAQ